MLLVKMLLLLLLLLLLLISKKKVVIDNFLNLLEYSGVKIFFDMKSLKLWNYSTNMC
jgi:hypothetical protein